MVEGANHNFTGVSLQLMIRWIKLLYVMQQKYDEVNQTILEWLEQAREGILKSGIWKTGVKTKL